MPQAFLFRVHGGIAFQAADAGTLGHAFSAPTPVTFDAGCTIRFRGPFRASDDDPAGRSGPGHYEAQVDPAFERYRYCPIIRACPMARRRDPADVSPGDVQHELSQ